MSTAAVDTPPGGTNTDQHPTPTSFRILSIDGGGMRGIIPVHILSILESKLRAKTANPLAQVIDYFDIFAGTSTGSILLSALLLPDEKKRPKFSPDKILELYCNQGKIIFNRSLWKSITSISGIANTKYSDKGLRQVMQMYFGDTHLKDLLKPCLFTAYDIEARRDFFFRQHRARRQAHYDFKIRDLIRASVTAPAMFPVAEVRSQVNRTYHLIDGGTFAYNPALCIYAEVRRLHPKIHAKHMTMLSLGTGIEATPYPYQQARRWGAIKWMRPMYHISSSGTAEAVNFQLQQLFLTCENKDRYLRIDTMLDKENTPDLDDASPENLKRLMDIATELGKQYDKRLDEFTDLLLAHGQ